MTMFQSKKTLEEILEQDHLGTTLGDKEIASDYLQSNSHQDIFITTSELRKNGFGSWGAEEEFIYQSIPNRSLKKFIKKYRKRYKM